MEPDYDDPFSPPDIVRKVRCLHCGDEYLSDEIVYEIRAGLDLWWCKNKTCDGAGYGWDIKEIK